MTVLGTGVVPSVDVHTSEFSGRLHRPFGPPPHAGVLVLHGSDPDSTFPDEYARLLALHGYAALRIEYFGTDETPETLAEVPLEQFDAAIEWLRDADAVDTDRVGLLAWSRGTEAAFLTADRNPRAVGALVAYSPSAYAFPAYPPTDPARSAWSADGDPAAFLPPYDGIEDDEDEPGVVRFRRTVERASSDRRNEAALPVGNIDGPVLLVSGADDRIWPASEFAEELTARYANCNHVWPCRTKTYENAGHGITIPYEPLDEEILGAMGGTMEGTLHAATNAWEWMLLTLREGLYRKRD